MGRCLHWCAPRCLRVEQRSAAHVRSTRLGEAQAGCPRSVSVVAPCKWVLAAVRETAMAMVEQAQRTRAAYSIWSRVHAG